MSQETFSQVEPLIEEGRWSQNRTLSPFHGRQTALTHGDKFERAAALVDLAEDGVGIPAQVLESSNYEQATRLYFVYTRLDILWALNLTALIVLNFFEVPLWCKGTGSSPCGDKSKYYLGDLPYLSREESLIFEVALLAILLVYTFFPILFIGNKLFWSSRLDNVKVLLVALLTVDTIANAIYVTPVGPINSLPFRFGPYIRVLVVVTNIRELRDCLATLVGIVPDFVDAGVLLALFLMFSSWLGYILFEDTVQGKEIFTSFLSTFYSMTILFTTSNNPDVWLPAYQSNRFSSVFFILYILIGVYFVTNLVLAVVYDSFKGQLARHLLKRQANQQEVLETAFNILDEHRRGYLDSAQCSSLFVELNRYRTLPKIHKDDMDSIFEALDDSGDLKITKEEFADICLAISLKFDKAEEPTYFEESFGSVYNSSKFQTIQSFVKSKHFEYIILGMLTLNLVTVVVETTLDIENDSSQRTWQNIELIFGWLYFLEMLLKVVIYGFWNYWRSGQNQFDFIITWIIVIGETLATALPNGLPIISNEEWIRYLLIARLLRLTRVLMLVKRYRVKVATFINLIPSLTPYLGINFFLMCLYCTLGIQVFGGLVYDGNPKLKETTMADNGYMVHNFNDYATGMVTLFELLVMGNWQVWMESYGVLSSSWLAITYFISFYVLAILFLLNLVVAFVLEAFFTEIDMNEDTEEEGDAQSNEDTVKKVPKRKAQRARDTRVQNLLSHMLTAELERNKSEH